jgi:uncharacterized protein (DUF433 family)
MGFSNSMRNLKFHQDQHTLRDMKNGNDASTSKLLSRITIHPEICHGKPAIRHLRYPVESMLEYLAAGNDFGNLLAEFPDLERDDLRACIEFAAQSLKLKSRHLVLA